MVDAPRAGLLASGVRVRPSGPKAGWFVQKPTEVWWAFCVVEMARVELASRACDSSSS
jgi:hypothetical protein